MKPSQVLCIFLLIGAAEQVRSDDVINVTCNETVLVNASNTTFYFVDQVCNEGDIATTSATVFIIQFPSASNSPSLLGNISITIRNVALRGTLSFVVENTTLSTGSSSTISASERPTLRNFSLYLWNVSLYIGMTATISQRLLGEQMYSNSWTLLRIPWPSNSFTIPIGLIDALQLVMSNVSIATNSTTSNSSSFLDSMIVLQPTLLHRLNISIVNCTFHINTSSTLIALTGNVNVIGLTIQLTNVTVFATCASRGCIPIAVLCSRSSILSLVDSTLVGIHDTVVNFVSSNLTWNVVPRPLNASSAVAFPIVGNTFSLNPGFSGVVAVSLWQPLDSASAPTVSMRNIRLLLQACALRFWIEGATADAEVASDLDGFEAGVFVLSGYPQQGDVLKNSSITVNSSSIAIRSSSSTIARTSYFTGGAFNVTILVQDIGPLCQLFSEVRYSSEAASGYSAMIYTFNAPLRDSSFLTVQRIMHADCRMLSGEVLPAKVDNSSLSLVGGIAIFLTHAENASVLVEDVYMTTWFANGTFLPLAANGSVYPAVTIALCSSFILQNSIESMGPNSTLIVRNSSLHFLGASVIFSTKVFFGAAVVDVSAVLLAASPCATNVVIEDVAMVVNVDNLDLIQVGTFNAAVSLSMFLALMSLQAFATLFGTALVVALKFIAPSIATLNLTYSASVINLFAQIRGNCVVEQRWGTSSYSTPAGTNNRCSSSPDLCLFNTSAVFFGSMVVESRITVENVSFRASPSSLSAPSPATLAVSIFSVTLESNSLVTNGSQLVISSVDTRLSNVAVVAIAVLGVRDVVSSTLTLRNSTIAIVDCIINRTASDILAKSFGIVTSSLYPNTNGKFSLYCDTGSNFILQSTRIVSSRQLLFGDVSSGAVGVWKIGSLLILGCNTWNGVPFPGPLSSLTPLTGIPTSVRTFNETAIRTVLHDNTFDDCSLPLFSHTISAEATVSRLLVESDVAIVLPTVSPNTALLALAALDSVSLIAIGQSACASAELKQATSDTRYLLSPFYDYGGEASALGNVALLVVFGILHWSGSRILGRLTTSRGAQNVSPVVSSTQLQNNPLPAPFLPLSSPDKRRSKRAWWPSQGSVVAHFPNLTIEAITFLMGGTAFTAINVVTRGSTVAMDSTAISIFIGAISVVLVAAPGALLWYYENHCFVESGGAKQRGRGNVKTGLLYFSNFKFQAYSRRIRYSSRLLPGFAVPLGRWEPAEMRSSLGKLRGLIKDDDHRKRNNTRFALLPTMIAVFTSGVLGVQGPTAWWCPLQWALLSVATLLCAAAFGVMQPARIPLVNVLLAVQYSVLGAIFILSAVVHNDANQHAVVALMAVSTISTIVSILKVVHALLVFLWERERVAAEVACAPNSCTSTPGSAPLNVKKRQLSESFSTQSVSLGTLFLSDSLRTPGDVSLRFVDEQNSITCSKTTKLQQAGAPPQTPDESVVPGAATNKLAYAKSQCRIVPSLAPFGGTFSIGKQNGESGLPRLFRYTEEQSALSFRGDHENVLGLQRAMTRSSGPVDVDRLTLLDQLIRLIAATRSNQLQQS